MNATQFLNLAHHPLRLTADEAGWRLGFNRDEMRVCSSVKIIDEIRASEPKQKKQLLSARDRLIQLGTPWGSCHKFFAECQIAQRETDEEWLDRAVRTIRLYWRYKKMKNKSAPTVPAANPTKIKGS